MGKQTARAMDSALDDADRRDETEEGKDAFEGVIRPRWCKGWCTEAPSVSPELYIYRVLPGNRNKTGEPTSGLEPLTCSLRERIVTLRGAYDYCKLPANIYISFIRLHFETTGNMAGLVYRG